jgi:hypothetical protein
VRHFLDPSAVLREMVGVCAPGGRIAVVDICTSPDRVKAAPLQPARRIARPFAFRALPLGELQGLFRIAGCRGMV